MSALSLAPGHARWRVALVGVACLWCAGCAALHGAAPASPFRDPAMSMEQAGSVVGVGSSKAEVQARLGPGTAVAHFDSGFEVWVYRDKPAGAQSVRSAELVLLFAPSGTLQKMRLRPAAPMP